MSASGGGKRPALMHFIYSLGVGGAEKLAYDMSLRLPPESYRPVVVCVGEDGPLAGMLQEAGIPLYCRPNTPGETLGIVSWVKEIVEREEVAVIHAHQYNPLQYAVLAAIGNRRVNLVYTEHGRVYPERIKWKRYLTNPLFALRVNHMVSVSESTRNAMKRFDNLPARRIEVIRNGIVFEHLNPPIDREEKRRSLGIPPGSRIVGTASRLEEVKNIPMMLRAFTRIVEEIPDTVLMIAGHGSQRESLQAMALELGISDRVLFLGLRSDLTELFQLLDVFLLVSFTEGISITLLEAMGSGVPAVVTRAGGNPEVVLDGETGYLVEVGDEGALAARVLELLASPENAARLGRAGNERVRRSFGFDTMMQSYLHLYRSGRDSHDVR